MKENSPSKIFLSSLLIPATLITLFLGTQISFAAGSVVDNLSVTPAPFYTQIPGLNIPTVANFSYTYNSGGWTSAQITEQVRDSKGNVVYFWGNNEADNSKVITYAGSIQSVKLTWDGKSNFGSTIGQYVPDGDYTFYVMYQVGSGVNTEASSIFHLTKAIAPQITANNTPVALYYNGNKNLFTIGYNFTKGTGSLPVVRLTVEGPLAGNKQSYTVVDNSKISDGDYVISWDGTFNGTAAPSGDYTYKLDAVTNISDNMVTSNAVTGTFKISNNPQPTPVVSKLQVSPSIFSPLTNGVISFGYNLAGSLGFTSLNAAIFNSNDLTTAVKTWNLTNQANGDNALNWDGKTTDSSTQQVANGSYIFKITGSDGGFSLVPQQQNFTINYAPATSTQQTQTFSTSEQCSGFTDVSKNDADCDAITYLKSIGAMTGNTDGTFSPDGLLQRDQISKIVLETFSLFNKQIDYCQNKNPFPDVSKANWAYQYICRGLSKGTITGYTSGQFKGMFMPARSVNRAEFLALVLRNLDEDMPGITSSSYTDIDPGQWFSGYAKYSKDHSLFVGASLSPNQYVTRREVAAVIYKLHLAGKV